jgi:hypothetical protein
VSHANDINNACDGNVQYGHQALPLTVKSYLFPHQSLDAISARKPSLLIARRGHPYSLVT